MNRVIRNVRQQSNAGWYVGGLYFYLDNVVSEDRESFYFPSEESLQQAYPNSISFKEACFKAKQRRWIDWEPNV